MRNYIFITKLIFAAVGLSTAPLSVVIAHEAHKMGCNETAMNAMNGDIQSMPDGEAKAKAMKEMDMAGQMMAKKDMKGCEAHMHNAMKALEE